MKQQEYVNFGSIGELSSIVSSLAARRIFLVTGKDSYRTCGAEDRLNRILSGYETQRFTDFSKNPKLEDAVRGIEVFKASRCDVIIAVGGGSAIDMAKLINFFACSHMAPSDLVNLKAEDGQKGKPLIAIPTTAGTGSEATQFAVVYIDKIKFSVDNKYILPDVAIVDPEFTLSLPRYVTATTGIDALGQAIESYWSINSNSKSKALAGKAIELIISSLAATANEPTAPARLAMAKAANLAGKAINITRTTACHSISYPLTSCFGIPHGHAVGLTLAPMLEYISGVCDDDVTDSRGCDYVRKATEDIAVMLGAKDVPEAVEKIQNLMETIGLHIRLSALGIRSENDIETIVDYSLEHGRTKNNPRKVTREALKDILEQIR